MITLSENLIVLWVSLSSFLSFFLLSLFFHTYLQHTVDNAQRPAAPPPLCRSGRIARADAVRRRRVRRRRPMHACIDLQHNLQQRAHAAGRAVCMRRQQLLGRWLCAPPAGALTTESRTKEKGKGKRKNKAALRRPLFFLISALSVSLPHTHTHTHTHIHTHVCSSASPPSHSPSPPRSVSFC